MVRCVLALVQELRSVDITQDFCTEKGICFTEALRCREMLEEFEERAIQEKGLLSSHELLCATPVRDFEKAQTFILRLHCLTQQQRQNLHALQTGLLDQKYINNSVGRTKLDEFNETKMDDGDQENTLLDNNYKVDTAVNYSYDRMNTSGNFIDVDKIVKAEVNVECEGANINRERESLLEEPSINLGNERNCDLQRVCTSDEVAASVGSGANGGAGVSSSTMMDGQQQSVSGTASGKVEHEASERSVPTTSWDVFDNEEEDEELNRLINCDGGDLDEDCTRERNLQYSEEGYLLTSSVVATELTNSSSFPGESNQESSLHFSGAEKSANFFKGSALLSAFAAAAAKFGKPSYRIPDSARRVYCDYCNYSTTNRMIMKQHIKKHGGDARIMLYCPMCPYETLYRTCFNEHFDSQHTTGHGEFICNKCSYSTTYKANLYRHLNRHRGGKKRKLKCPLCPYECLGNLTRHIKQHHDIANIMQKCPFCEYQTLNKSRFEAHVNSHKNVNKFTCRVCRFSTFSTETYARHMAQYHEADDSVNAE